MSFFDSDTSLRRLGKVPYRDEATAVVWIECLVLIGAQNRTSFNLKQTINERINLSKTEKGEKKVPRAPLVVSDLRSSERGFYHYTSIRSHTLSICKFMTYSVTTLQECGHLTVAGVFWQWKTAPSSLLYFSIEVTKIVVPSLTKNGVRRTIYWWLKTWLTIISSLVSVLICYSLLVIRLHSQVPQAHEWESLFHKRNIIKLSTAELKLAGISLKRPKMLRKHHIFRQLDKVRNSDVFLLLFLTLK